MNIENYRNITNNFNMNPLDDFNGFSPKQMHAMLYNPFEESCPIQIKEIISKSTLSKIPAISICKKILKNIDPNDGIKLTKTGNLPPKIIISIYEQGILVDESIDRGITKLKNEKDWIAFHSLHITLLLSGLLQKSKGKEFLTNKCKRILSNNDDSSLFIEIFKYFCTKFNWAYNDAFENQYTGQFGFLFIYHLLIKYQKERLDLKLIADKYFRAFPNLQIISQYDTNSYYTTGDFIIESRFFHRFAEWFGISSIYTTKPKSFQDRRVKIKCFDTINEIVEYSKE